jgi:hypothetical protein
VFGLCRPDGSFFFIDSRCDRFNELPANTRLTHLQPEERPLRVKRSRKSNLPTDGADDDTPAQENAGEGGDGEASLPRLAPAPSQHELTSSFRVKSSSNGVQDAETPADGDNQDAQSEAQAGETGADDVTTPMDVDSKEPKAEQG